MKARFRALFGSSLPNQIAKTIIAGFDNHYRIFRDSCRKAKLRFEGQDWQAEQAAVRDRIKYYDERVHETVQTLRHAFSVETLADETWQQVKHEFINRLINHKQPELAESFFNSVCCRILNRTYFHNDYIFARPTISTEFINSYPPTYICFYPQESNLRNTLRQVLLQFDWQVPFENLSRDIEHIVQAMDHYLEQWPKPEANLQIQILHSPFYRSKTASIIGRLINGYQEYPFAIIIRHGSRGLVVDTILLEPWRISLLFSLSRAYFMVDMEVPSGYVNFLRTIMPNKPRGELYTTLGLGKQGKTMFYRDLTSHLAHSRDQFILAPGTRGMVMTVFTLPSFPYVFKVIKDPQCIRKEMDPETVKRKYQMVKQIDRVGRMADSLEFSKVALPRQRFHPEALKELREECCTSLEEDEFSVVISHLYIERRLTPLNIYLTQADDTATERTVIEYGNAIREMCQANIFPGDMLWKNFGVTRYGRVVFYDYDEIEYMTDCNFRHIPPAPNPEAEMSAEAWYAVGRNDVFPEEFATFLLGMPRIREAFLKHHPDLLRPEFWQETQKHIRAGHIEDFYPYPQEMRFGHP
jgi:isocitrate dehydrogenase kinase/phosphatase